MDTPNQSPCQPSATGLAADQVARKRRFWLWMIWVSIAGLITAPAVSVVGSMIGIARSFAAMHDDVNETNSSIWGASDTTISATIICFASLAFLIIAPIRFRRLPKPA